MKTTNSDYMEGWMDLARDVLRTISSSIKIHRGAKSIEDVVAVYNDLIQMSHRLNAFIVEYESENQESHDSLSEHEERPLYLAIDNSMKEE